MNYALLIAALIQVESGGRDLAVGDGGQAVGCLQLHPAFVQEVNRIGSTRFRLDSRRNRADSIIMAQEWLRHYAAAFERRTGCAATTEDLARIFNQGLSGYISSPWKSERYWQKVSEKLKQNANIEGLKTETTP